MENINIIKEYKKYKLKNTKETINDICKPSKFKLQPQQQFLSEYLWNNKKKVNGLLIYHQIGSGKTCTAINISEQFKKTMKIIIVLPASLIGNFMDELRSDCTGKDTYIKTSEKKILNNLDPNTKEFNDIIKKTEERINKYYKIYSYNKFIDLVDKNKINFKNTLLIIDEIQNMISMSGTYYSTLKNMIDTKTDETFKIFLLSATPMFDKPIEIALTLNLLKPKTPFSIDEFNNNFLLYKKNTYKVINIDKFKKLTQGLISYYRGANPIAFPKMEFKVVKCSMSNFQYKSYLTSLSIINKNIKNIFENTDILNMPGNFFLGPRILSNIAFPNKKIGHTGFSSLKGSVLELQNIKKYSIKFYKIFKNIKRSEGPVFIYSNFKDIGGLKSFIIFLEANGFKNYKNNGEGLKRFCIWTGDEPVLYKEKIKYIFNQLENKNGTKIKIMLGSPSIKEGVSLKNISQIHIMEPYWNISRILQIIGRGIRFCSHSNLEEKRRVVQVFLYLCVHPLEKQSVDEYIWSLGKKKHVVIKEFEHALKEVAIDCELFHAKNYYKNIDDKPLICSK